MEGLDHFHFNSPETHSGTCREHWPSGLDSESDPALETDIAPFPCDEQASTQAKQGTASR